MARKHCAYERCSVYKNLHSFCVVVTHTECMCDQCMSGAGFGAWQPPILYDNI
jgi:hypothetical protein